MQIPQVFPVACHTDHVGRGTTFVAIKGERYDGADYIPLALKKGAVKIVVGNDVQLGPEIERAIKKSRSIVLRVEDTRHALAQLSAQALNYPAKKLKIIGITGTKGKTSTAYLLEHILKKSGHTTALMTTVKNSIGDHEFKARLTTQQPDYLHVFFDMCVQAGVEYVVMEVAAQALTLHRVAGILFVGAIFTNFSHEHLEFYKDLDEYFAAKCLLLAQCTQDAPILINADDDRVSKLAGEYCVERMSCADAATDFCARVRGAQTDAIRCDIIAQGQKIAIECPALFGAFNVYNVLAAVAMAFRCGVPLQSIAHSLLSFTGIPGRLESYAMPNGARFIIDYAHNPDSYRKVLTTLRSMTKLLIVIFGAGGGRDKYKRPIMGGIASEIADVVFLTSDNPRFEDPQHIIQDILAGVEQQHQPKIMQEIDRELAMRKAYALSSDDAIIVVLGKGPDTYQEIKDQKLPFHESRIIVSMAS